MSDFDEWTQVLKDVRQWPVSLLMWAGAAIGQEIQSLEDAYICDSCLFIYPRHGIRAIKMARTEDQARNVTCFCWVCMARKRQEYLQHKLAEFFGDNEVSFMPVFDVVAGERKEENHPTGQYL